VTVLVALPLTIIVGFRAPWHMTFVVAFISTGTGALLAGLIGQVLLPPPTNFIAEETKTDREWKIKMLLRKAVACEDRGEWDAAVALFEQISAQSPYGMIGQQARDRVRAIREKTRRDK
jgi:hypothetical protein